MNALWMIAASLAYAAMGAFIKLAAAENVPVAQITFYRCLISLGAVYVILRMSAIPIATPYWRAHLTRSVTGVGSLAAYYTAVSLLPLATATTLNYTTPLFVAMAMLAIGAWRRTIAYQKGDTLVAASLGYSQVIFASVLGLWLWSELPAGQAWIGMALIVASGLATTLRGR